MKKVNDCIHCAGVICSNSKSGYYNKICYSLDEFSQCSNYNPITLIKGNMCYSSYVDKDGRKHNIMSSYY